MKKWRLAWENFIFLFILFDDFKIWICIRKPYKYRNIIWTMITFKLLVQGFTYLLVSMVTLPLTENPWSPLQPRASTSTVTVNLSRCGVREDGWRAMTEWTDDLVHLPSLCPTPKWKKDNTAFHFEQFLKISIQSLHTFCLKLPTPFIFDINWWHIPDLHFPHLGIFIFGNYSFSQSIFSLEVSSLRLN